MKTKRILDPEALAAKIADRAVPSTAPDFYEVISEERGEDRWGGLIAGLTAELPEHVKKRWLSLDAKCDLLEKVKAGLPQSLHDDLFLMGEADDIDSNVREEAAYLIGVEVGRRISVFDRGAR